MQRVILIIGITILVISALVSCSSPTTNTQTTTTIIQGNNTTASPTTSTPAPKFGGVLKLVVQNPSNYFGYPGDMAVSGGAEISVPCLEQLVHLDSKGKFEPTGLVTAYKVAPDLKSITFTLRQGVKFHDGTDLNAQAVKWSLEQGMKSRLAGTELFTSVDVVDDYNVRVNAEHVDNRVFQAAADAKVSSPTAFDKYGKDGIHTHPVGTGPFKFASYSPDISVTWERFDDYWGGKPYLDGIQSFFIKDDMARSAALQSGAVDILFSVLPETALNLQTKGYTVAPGNIPVIMCLFPDSANQSSPLSKLSVRQAIEYAIDRNELAKLGNGFWLPATQPSEPTSPGYISDFEGRQYNVGKAQELLSQAGYADGFEISIMFASNKNLQDPMVAVQQMLSTVGIKIDVQSVTSNVRNDYSRNGWQNGFNIQNVYAGPTQYLSALNYCLGGPMFVSCARPPGWVDALNEAFFAGPEDFDQACRKLNTLLYDDATLLPLYVTPTVIYAMSNYVQDAHLYESGNLYRWTPEKAWLNK